jgi:hypothetical protein
MAGSGKCSTLTRSATAFPESFALFKAPLRPAWRTEPSLEIKNFNCLMKKFSRHWPLFNNYEINASNYRASSSTHQSTRRNLSALAETKRHEHPSQPFGLSFQPALPSKLPDHQSLTDPTPGLALQLQRRTSLTRPPKTMRSR